MVSFDMNTLLHIAEYAAAIGGGIAAINQWVIKPLKNLWNKQFDNFNRQHEEQRRFNEKISKDMDMTNQKIDKLNESVNEYSEDVADLLGDRLMEAHDHFTMQGWCSPADKERFVNMHKRYTQRGHNHLTQKYEDDLLKLPDAPMMA